MAELFRGLELTLLKQICERLNLADQLNEVTVDAMRALRSHGISQKDIEKASWDVTGISQKKLDKLLDDVVERNQAYYTEMIDLAHVTAPATLVNADDIEAIRKQAQREFRNITASMGFLVDSGRTMLKPAKAYQWALDSAVMAIQSGSISYNEAIRRAVRELADSGLKTVDYESGHVDQIDVAARRAVMTGVNQLNQKYREASMDYLETDLVEVTAHLGARNIDGPKGWENHAKWQGKVYRWKDHGERTEQKEPEQTVEKEPASAQKAPIAPITSAPASATRNMPEPIDVTEEYISSATPGQGEFTFDNGYDREKNKDETNFAKWIFEKLGGNIRLLKERNIQNQKNPDYSWNGKLWDLKTSSTEKAANTAIQRGLAQIKENPGGVMLDYRGVQIDVDLLMQVIGKRMQWIREGSQVDIMLVLNDGEIKMLRYKK